MATFINPFVDRGFKLLFGREESKDLLIDLLNGLFEGERVITELSFMNVEQPAECSSNLLLRARVVLPLPYYQQSRRERSGVEV